MRRTATSEVTNICSRGPSNEKWGGRERERERIRAKERWRENWGKEESKGSQPKEQESEAQRGREEEGAILSTDMRPAILDPGCR